MAELVSKTGFAEIQGAPLYYEVAGEGHPLLLLHAGIADCRMWDEQFAAFAQHYRVIRYDLRGFGRSTIPANPHAQYEDPAGLLDHLNIAQAHVLGISFGARTALDFTLAHPDRVTKLILVAPGISGGEPSEDMLHFWEQEEKLLEHNDLSGAAELNVRMCVDGPKRTPEQVEPTVRKRIYEMQYHAFTVPVPEGAEEIELQPPAISRLQEIQIPTLLIVGDYDLPSKVELTRQLAKELPHARAVIIENTAHVPNMEKPEEFNRHVLAFLAE
jgi:3-oxoadipate enol-lactonase